MGRGKNLNGAEPWKEYGLTKGAYYNRMRNGIPDGLVENWIMNLG